MKKQILFVGNSYTYYHDMPECIFAPMATEAGYDLEVRSVTHGGYKLVWYADPENEEGKRLRAVIEGRHFDYIVLQDHSLSTIENPGEFFDGVRRLKALGMTNAEMTRHVAEMYDEAGQRFDMKVAHVGKAFADYSAAHPEAELYFEDLHHSSRLGSTIAAQTILRAMTE